MPREGKGGGGEVGGPPVPGWEISHGRGSPGAPNRLYASQCSGWFGQLIQRSNDGGKTWDPVGNKFVYEGTTGNHLWYDGTPHPWEFKRVWHLEPSLTDPDSIYAGVEDAALFHSADGVMICQCCGWPTRTGIANAASSACQRYVTECAASSKRSSRVGRPA